MVNPSSIILIKPTKAFERTWQESLPEFRAENCQGFWNCQQEPGNMDDYLKTLEENEKGKNLPGAWVPSSTFWLMAGDQFIGHVNIRHELNESLLKVGGNIGY